MEGMSAEGILGIIAKNAEKNAVTNDGDFENEDGLLVCCKCGKPKQLWVYPRFNDDGTEDKEHGIKVRTMCKCDEERRAKEELEKKRQEAVERVKRLRALSLMDKKFEAATFSSYEITKHNERILKSCKRYVQDFDKNVEINKGLLFWGGVGTGKSWAAACIANELLSKGVPVIMTSFVKLIGQIQSGEETEADILYRLNRAKLIVFDDLGAERSTEYAIERVYNIIDSRYRAELPMIVTTNLTIDEMTADTDRRFKRIYDRLFETCVPVQFTGPSWRMKAASKRFKSVEANTEDEL